MSAAADPQDETRAATAEAADAVALDAHVAAYDAARAACFADANAVYATIYNAAKDAADAVYAEARAGRDADNAVYDTFYSEAAEVVAAHAAACAADQAAAHQGACGWVNS